MPVRFPGMPFWIGTFEGLPSSPQNLNWKLVGMGSKFTIANWVMKFPPSAICAILSAFVKLSEGGRTVRVKVWLENADALSVTPTVKLYVPGVTGVPLSTPALESDSPGGNAPDINAQL